jgi:hypothetical protein
MSEFELRYWFWQIRKMCWKLSGSLPDSMSSHRAHGTMNEHGFIAVISRRHRVAP